MGTIRTILAVDGESRFKNSMKEINSTLKAMQSNVKALSTEYIHNGREAENLRKQKEQLSEIEKQQQEKIKLLSAAVERSGEAYNKAKEKMLDMVWLHGRESEEAEKARKALASATVTYNNYQTQLHNTEAALNETQASIRANNQAIKNSEESLNANKKQWKELGEGIKNTAKIAGNVAKAEFAMLQTSIKAVSTEFELGIKGLTSYASAIVSASTAVGKFSIDKGANFEQSMSKLQAISQESPENMERLEAAAKAAGKSTSKSASESADALSYMALAGWNTEEMLKGLNPIIRASEVGAMDLATASDLITDSMAAYGKTADDMTKYLDILTAAQSNSNSSLQQMLEAYVEVGGTFKNLNVPMEESASILGVLADRGIKGSTAGNKLSSTLVNLIGANKNADSAMSELGVSAWDAEGNFIGLSETIKLLGDSLSELSDEEMMKFEAKIGGKMQIDTLQALIAGTSDEFDDLVDKLEESKGALQETAEIMMDNFNGAVTRTQAALEALGISIFGVFSEQLQANVQLVAEWASTIASTIERGPGYSVANVVKGLLGSELKKTVKTNISEISKMLPTITETFNAITLTVVDTILETSSEATTSILPQMITGFSDLANGLIERLPDFANQIGEAGRTLFDNLIPNMQDMADNLVEQFPIVIENLISWIDGEGVAQTYLAGLDILISIVNGIADNLPVIVEEGMAMIMSMIQGMANRLPDVLSTGMSIIYTLIDGVVNNLPEIITTAVDIVLALVDSITENLPKIIRVALQIILALIEGLIKNLGKITARVPEIVMAIVDAVLDNLDMILNVAIDLIFALGTGLLDAIPMIWDLIVEIPVKIGEKLLSGDYWSQLGQRCLEGIADGFSNIGSYVHQKVLDAGNALIDQFESFFQIHSPSRVMEDKVGKYIGLGIADGTADALSNSKLTLDEASIDYSNQVMSSVQRAFNADVNISPISAGNTTVEQTITFGAVYINNNMDIEEIAYQIAEKSRSYVVGGGGY